MWQISAKILNKLLPRLYWDHLAGCRPRFTSLREVIFYSPRSVPFSGGKVECWRFFPPFCRELASLGVATSFCTRQDKLLQHDAQGKILVLVYKEVADSQRLKESLPAIQSAHVLHQPSMGEIIGNKTLSNKLLARNEIKVPPILTSSTNKVFSNSDQSSGANTQILSVGNELDANRYNTEFIDTVVRYDGQDFYTSVRMLCVGRKLIHAYCRARSTSESNASVHAKDTPLDPGLIEWLQRFQVTARYHELEKIADSAGKVLGLGFFSYDLLLDQYSDRFYVAEPGYKFNDPAYVERLRPIAQHLPSHEILFSDSFARRSARLFFQQLPSC